MYFGLVKLLKGLHLARAHFFQTGHYESDVWFFFAFVKSRYVYFIKKNY